VRLSPKKWHFFAREFKPAHNHGDWAFYIDKDYNPGDAKEAFNQCQMASMGEEFLPMVGLRPALDSYLKKG